MKTATLSRMIGIAEKDVAAFLEMSAEDIFRSPGYMNLLGSLNRDLLEETLPDARAIYEKQLPAFKEQISKHFDVNTDPMSPYTLGNWLVGVTRYPSTANQMMKMHSNVPGHVVRESLPDLVSMMDAMPGEAAAEWKRALCVVALPMMKM